MNALSTKKAAAPPPLHFIVARPSSRGCDFIKGRPLIAWERRREREEEGQRGV